MVNHNSLRTCNKYTSATQFPLELHLVFPCLCLLPSLLLPAKASRLYSPSAGKRGPHGALLAEMRTALRILIKLTLCVTALAQLLTVAFGALPRGLGVPAMGSGGTTALTANRIGGSEPRGQLIGSGHTS